MPVRNGAPIAAERSHDGAQAPVPSRQFVRTEFSQLVERCYETRGRALVRVVCSKVGCERPAAIIYETEAVPLIELRSVGGARDEGRRLKARLWWPLCDVEPEGAFPIHFPLRCDTHGRLQMVFPDATAELLALARQAAHHPTEPLRHPVDPVSA